MSLWFRMYTGIVNSSKVQSMPDRLFRIWVNLLCIAKENDGIFPPDAEIAFQLRCSEKQVRNYLEELKQRNLVDSEDGGETLKPHDWNEHQYISDVSTNRVKKFREAKKELKGNVSGTSPEQSRAEQIPPTPKNGAVNEFESKLSQVAESIHERHPELRRDIGIKAITAKLRTICKGVPVGKLGLLSEIDESHAEHCDSEQWTRDGGQFAKGLENWLAPSKRRWESSAGPKADAGLELFNSQPPESMVIR